MTPPYLSVVNPFGCGCPIIYMHKFLKELEKQERSLRWLSRKVGVHYQTAIRWKDSGIPRWHHKHVAEILKRPVKELFNNKKG